MMFNMYKYENIVCYWRNLHFLWFIRYIKYTLLYLWSYCFSIFHVVNISINFQSAAVNKFLREGINLSDIEGSNSC